MCDQHLGALLHGLTGIALFEAGYHALYTHPEPYAGRGPPPQLLDQPVVPPAAHYGALSAFEWWSDLEHRPRIVVEAADQPVVDLVRQSQRGQVLLQAVPVTAASVTEMIGPLGRRFDHLLARLLLAVEKA